MPYKQFSPPLAETFHNPKWAEHPCCSRENALSRFHLVDSFLWRDMKAFYMLVARKYFASSNLRVSLPKRDIPIENIILFCEEMDYTYKSARRDSFLAAESITHS